MGAARSSCVGAARSVAADAHRHEPERIRHRYDQPAAKAGGLHARSVRCAQEVAGGIPEESWAGGRQISGRARSTTPFCGTDGSEVAVLYRVELQRTGTGDPFKWKRKCKPTPYGLERLDQAKAAGSVAIVEGPSDAQNLWYHNSQALGLPSARWDEKWADYLDGITTIYVVIEPDSAGQKVRRV